MRGMTETEATWSQRIREWKASGRPLQEFVQGQPYKAATLRWWATELRRRARVGTSGRRKRPESAASIPMAQVVRQRAEQPNSKGVVVEVSGARISVERGFDAELFGAVVRALGGGR